MSPATERRGGQAMTVAGPVKVEELGLTLFHEHLHMDATPLLAVHGYPGQDDQPFDAEAAAEARWNPGSHPDNYRFVEDDLVVDEAGRFRDAGGGCIVDQTPQALGRDPVALASIAERSGLHVIMGTGHYLAPTHAPWIAGATEDRIAGRIIEECRDGVGETGIRPGIIGEIGTSVPIDPEEVRVLRAAARAALVSGVGISVHLHPGGLTGRQVLDALLGEGVEPERVALGHLTTASGDEAYLRSLAERGASLVFDLFGFDHSLIGIGRWPPSDRDVALVIAGLVGAGHGRQVMISHDIGVRTRLVRYGSWGYAHIPRHVVPLLLEAGLSERDVTRILVENPARILTVEGL